MVEEGADAATMAMGSNSRCCVSESKNIWWCLPTHNDDIAARADISKKEFVHFLVRGVLLHCCSFCCLVGDDDFFRDGID